MARKTLGLDLGTNSIGWAIVFENKGKKQLEDAGVVIFQEGVAREKGNEKPATQDRTASRSQRRLYFRRRMRKKRLLEFLVKEKMCPLPHEAVMSWIRNGQYPQGYQEFNEWFMMDPYKLRAKGLNEKLTTIELGRVFYHIAQRRGFRSNRKGGAGELEGLKSGSEERGIRGLNDTAHLIQEHRTLGAAGVALAKKHIPIRKRYTMRSDYIAEFEQIWKEQTKHHPELNDAMKRKIGDPKDGLLFFQRPLKSQKGNVGRCTLEPSKQRAPISSLHAEVFNVLQILNNLKVNDVPLNETQRGIALKKFMAKSPNFTVKQLSSAFKKAKMEGFLNYKDDVKFNTAHTISILADLFDVEPIEIFNDPDNKIWEDRWAVIYNAEDGDELSKLQEEGRDIGKKRDLKMYAMKHWGFDDEMIEKLLKVNWKQGYHRLSRKALRKIIPFMAKGIRYDEAVLFANLGEAVDGWQQMSEEGRKVLQQGLVDVIEEQKIERWRIDVQNALVQQYREIHTPNGGEEDFWDDEWAALLDRSISGVPKDILGKINDLDAWKETIVSNFLGHTALEFKPAFFSKRALRVVLREFLEDQFGEDKVDFSKMYHHSAIENYQIAEHKLGSPRIPGLKNPMVERALHTLRHLVNDLIEAGKVDRKTKVHIELAREMDTANRRKAWQSWQSDRKGKRDDALKELQKHFKKDEHWDPGEALIEKMWLYQEAIDIWGKAVCVYTGEAISIEQLVRPKVDVEHTWPRAETIDNSKANKMLCFDWYNRTVKSNSFPAKLPNFAKICTLSGKEASAIEPRLEKIKARMDKYEKDKDRARHFAKQKTTKAGKDTEIQKAHLAQFHFNYWRTKYERLSSAEMRPGFLNRQIVGTGQISRLARQFLGSYFRNINDKPNVHAFQGEATAAFRREWLGEKFGTPKDRSRHAHHAKDATVLAAIDRSDFDRLARHYRENDNKFLDKRLKEPWDGFCNEVNTLDERILIYHDRPDRVGTRSKYKLGKVNGKMRWATGDTVRGSLHKETYYGRIKQRVEGTDEFTEHTVLRKKISALTTKDILKIVDPVLREKVKRYGLEKIQAQGYMPVQVKENGKMVEHRMNKVRLFDGFKNPVAIREHRDIKEGREHKQFLWVKNDENYCLAVYRNEKGKLAHYVFSLMEIEILRSSASNRHHPIDLLPDLHPEKSKFNLVIENGRPLVYRPGQHVLLYEDSADEIDFSSVKDLSSRLYVVRKVEGDGRINMLNHMDSRPDNEIAEVSKWNPEVPNNWLRIRLSKLKCLNEPNDFVLNDLGRVIPKDN